MQNNEQSLLLHRENYEVPKGQEQSVHCKVAKMDENGNFYEKPRVLHFGVKSFDTMDKVNLEAMGYSVEILYHPNGRYTNVRITSKEEELARKDAEIAELKAQIDLASVAEKDAEIARLKAELAKAAKPDAKGGRPKKEA